MNQSNHQPETTGKSSRLSCVDALRGFVIILMALDHSRDFFHDLRIQPLDPETTDPLLFFTRWVTHFCAPTFVFLAGASAYFAGRKHQSKRQFSFYLLTRGAWLVFLEFTIIHFALSLNSWTVPFGFLVIAAIGSSMIGLSLLCYLPTAVVAFVGIVLVAGHNLLDSVSAATFGAYAPLWNILHDGPAYLPDWHLEIAYPILPWLGIMACGYGFGAVLIRDREVRLRQCRRIGVSLLVLFFIVRWLNAYGNPTPWSLQLFGAQDGSIAESTDSLRTMFSFLNCQKYPPSLAYTLMTLGPAIIVLSCLDVVHTGPLTKTFRRFGQVPLFFYILHFYFLHLTSCFFYWYERGVFLSPFQAIYGQIAGRPVPDEYGFSTLWITYCAWLVTLIVMWPLCGIYSKAKRAGKSKIWSYL